MLFGCDSWTLRNAERRRIDAFEMWCWRRFLRVPWTARRSNQSILKEINSEYSLERLTLKLQSSGHLMQRADTDAGKDWGQEEKGAAEDEMVGWHHWLSEHNFEQTAVQRVTKSQTWQRLNHDRGSWEQPSAFYFGNWECLLLRQRTKYKKGAWWEK